MQRAEALEEGAEPLAARLVEQVLGRTFPDDDALVHEEDAVGQSRVTVRICEGKDLCGFANTP